MDIQRAAPLIVLWSPVDGRPPSSMSMALSLVAYLLPLILGSLPQQIWALPHTLTYSVPLKQLPAYFLCILIQLAL